MCTVTFAVLDAPRDDSQKRFLGVASNYLQNLDVGDSIQVSVKASHMAFHPPSDPTLTPIIMICAGTGIAPFKGFVQERAMQIKAGRSLAPALLFVGCRHEDRDMLYKTQFEDWAKLGAVDVRYALSQQTEKSEGCKYVQDRLWKDRGAVVELFDAGARVYVCGSSKVGEAVRNTAIKIYTDTAESRGKTKTEDEVKAWFDGIRNERYASDVFT